MTFSPTLLDTVAGAFCMCIAFATFTVETLTSVHSGRWLNLPRYLRIGLFLTGGAMLYRGVNFLNIAGRFSPPPLLKGHANIEGIIVAACLAYTMSALAVWVINRNEARAAAKGQREAEAEVAKVVKGAWPYDGRS